MTAIDELFLLQPESQDIPRHQSWGGPMVKNPDTGKREYHRRPSTIAKVLSDQGGLLNYYGRETAVGMSRRPDLLTLVQTTARDDKKALDDIVTKAMAAAESDSAAMTGTILHGLTAHADLGGDIEAVPSKHRADVAAYVAATSDLWQVLACEQFVVIDDIKAAGTTDRLVWAASAARLRTADLKTSKWDPMRFGGIEAAMQIAMYAHGARYDDETGDRTPLPTDTEVGYVIWLPQGEGRCTVYEVQLAEAWDWVLTSMRVMDWRKAAGRILTPVAEGAA